MERNPILEGLFATQAVQVSPPDAPFWYTSGKFGPYYVNTHYLFGGRKSAEEALAAIDAAVLDRASCPGRLRTLFLEGYARDPVYRTCIDALCDAVRRIQPDRPPRLLSGGERRDWYFSLPVADRLGLPHVSLFKDGEAWLSEPGSAAPARKLAPGSLQDLRAVHVVDIVTEASSFLRAWIPFLQGLGAVFEDALTVVDRVQGGTEALAEHGVRLHALARVTPPLFHEAAEAGHITAAQADLAVRFTGDPDGFLRSFLAEHPGFLDRTLALGGKNAEKAKLGREKGFYG